MSLFGILAHKIRYKSKIFIHQTMYRYIRGSKKLVHEF